MLIPLGILIGMAVRAILGAPDVNENPMQLDSYANIKASVMATHAKEDEPVKLNRRNPLDKPRNQIEVPAWRERETVVDNPLINQNHFKI